MKKFRDHFTNRLFKELCKEVKTHKKTITTPDAYNRRAFITQTAKSVVGLSIALGTPSFLTSCKIDHDNNETTEHSDILDLAILGAGMAGLNCANHLLKSNLNFKIFEATNRVGGRMLTHYNDSMGLGIYPEFGGDFIDSTHTDMLELAKEFNLELIDLIKEQQENHWAEFIYFFDNRRLSEKEIITEFKKIAPKIAADIDSLGENYDSPKADEFDNLPLSEYIASLKCAKWLKELFEAAFVAEFGLDSDEQSTINFLDIIDTDISQGFKIFGDSDERFRVKGGNSMITNALAGKVGMEKINLGFVIKEITENDNGIYTIVAEDGNSVQAKQVVCTLPFTILRELKLKFKNISPEKTKCINELGYGVNTKLILGYEGQPWRSKENMAMGYIFHKIISNGWDTSYNKKADNSYGAYVCFLGGRASVELSKKAFKNPISPPNHIWKTELPEEDVLYYVNQLEKVFKHSKEKFTGKHVFVNWIQFPYVKASYTCYKPGQWRTISGLEMEPVGNFFFAGEHCSVEFQGYMNGAAETGRKVVQAILQAKTTIVH